MCNSVSQVSQSNEIAGSHRRPHPLQGEFQALVEHAPDLIERFDRNLRLLYINPIIQKFTGLPPQHFLGKTKSESGFPAPLCQLWEQSLRRVFETAHEAHFDFEFASPDGLLYFQARIVPEFSAHDEVESVLAVVRDISERRRVEQSLQESEERFRTIFEDGPLGMVVVDPAHHLIQVNPALCRMLGYTEAELLGKTFEEITHPDDLKADLELAGRLVRGEIAQFQLEKRYLRKDGRPVPLILTASLVRSPGGRPACFLGMIENISDRLEAQERLRQNGQILHRLIDSNIIGIVQSDVEQVLDANDVFLRIIGHSREELRAGQIHWRQLTPPEYAPLDQTGVEQLRARGACTPYEKEYLRSDGSRVPVLIGAATLSDSPLKWIAFVMDLSKRKQAEKELAAAKQHAEAANAAKDQFLAMLSHELRTPLTPVLTSVQLLEMDSSLSPEQRELVTMIHRNVELEARLIDDLLDLTRVSRGKVELHLSALDLHTTLWHVLQICDGDIRDKQLRLTVELNAADRQVLGDAARLQQVLWNLLKNAVKFTPPGGRITLGTSNPTPGQLAVTVSDSGMGIDEQVLPRLFSAFEQGRKQITRQFGGLGLGLAISKGLVDLHHGTLTAQSDGPGKGATFTLCLPALGGAAESAPVAATSDPAGSDLAGCRILLVEDHVDSAKLMTRLLEHYGFEVWTADSFTSAQQAARSDRFDLLISDIGLPDGSGLDLDAPVEAAVPN